MGLIVNVCFRTFLKIKMEQSVFGLWDYIIMAATMIASVAIGLYFRFSGGKQKTNEVGILNNKILIQNEKKSLGISNTIC